MPLNSAAATMQPCRILGLWCPFGPFTWNHQHQQQFSPTMPDKDRTYKSELSCRLLSLCSKTRKGRKETSKKVADSATQKRKTQKEIWEMYHTDKNSSVQPTESSVYLSPIKPLKVTLLPQQKTSLGHKSLSFPHTRVTHLHKRNE